MARCFGGPPSRDTPRQCSAAALGHVGWVKEAAIDSGDGIDAAGELVSNMVRGLCLNLWYIFYEFLCRKILATIFFGQHPSRFWMNSAMASSGLE